MNIDHVMAGQACKDQLGAFGCRKRYRWLEDFKNDIPCPKDLVMCCGFCIHGDDGSCEQICKVIKSNSG